MKFADSFRAARWVRLINLLLQAVLFLTLFGGLNFVAQNHAWRFDLTENHRYSLSAETKSYLDRLELDVNVYVTFPESSDNAEIDQARADLAGLLREYTYATRAKDEGRGRIDVRFVDIYVQRREAENLGLDNPAAVVVACENRRRTLTIEELYTIKDKVRRTEFKGEGAITAAILDVSQPDRKKIYFVQGHGELNPDDVGERGLSLLRDELRLRNFDLAALDLAATRKVPDDAALLLIVGPQARFQPFEEELLRNYLTIRPGRIVMMLGPGMKSIGLDNLLFDWGVLVHDNVIYDTNADFLTETGELYLRNFAVHPITQNLLNNQMALLVGPSRAVTDELGRSADDGLTVRTIIATSKTAWGETSYRLRIPPSYTYGQDLFGQFGVMVVSERVKPAPQINFSVRGGRLAVIGTADLVTNNRIINLGNLNVFLSLVNWAVDRDNQLNIPARPIERFQLALSREELMRLRMGLLLVVPGIVAALGLVVYWTRRN